MLLIICLLLVMSPLLVLKAYQVNVWVADFITTYKEELNKLDN